MGFAMSNLRDRILNASVPESATRLENRSPIAVALEAVESAMRALQKAREALKDEEPDPVQDEFGNCLHPQPEVNEVTTFGNEPTFYCHRCGEFLT